MKIATSLVTVLLLAGLMAGMFGCSSGVAAKEIKVGVIGPMTQSIGGQQWNGAQMAADEINNAGGVKVGTDTYTIKLLKYDSNEGASVTDAVNAVERAITVDKVNFLTGSFRSEAASAMQDVAVSNKVIFLSTGAASSGLATKVTDNYNKYKYWFRVMPSNDVCMASDLVSQLDMVAQKVRSETGITEPKVALLFEKDVFGDGVLAGVQPQIPALGLEVAGVWRPSPNATDVTAELTAIEQSGAQIVCTCLTGPVGIPFATEMNEMQVPAASVGVNAEAGYESFWDASGGKGNYAMNMSFFAAGVSQTNKTAPFLNEYVDKFGELPGFGATTNDALYILKAALEKAGSLDPDAVVTALEQTDYIGTAGHMVFTQSHDIACGFGNITYLATEWQNGKLVGVWPPADGSWHGVKYQGIVDYMLPPAVIDKWKQ
jgi:branched-chain amino acid transport system substrate-binding protein